MAVLLQTVCSNLIEQANAPTLLAQIDQHTQIFLGNHGHGCFQLRPAVAAQAGKNIAGQTFTVYAYEDIFLAPYVTADNGQMLLAIKGITVGVELKIAVGGRQVTHSASLTTKRSRTKR